MRLRLDYGRHPRSELSPHERLLNCDCSAQRRCTASVFLLLANNMGLQVSADVSISRGSSMNDLPTLFILLPLPVVSCCRLHYEPYSLHIDTW